jgi:class 3 adenylate cyclase
MSDKFGFYDDVEAIERYLNLPVGSLRNIPIYARKPAVDAILKVKEMEKTSIFRPGLYYIVLADLCDHTEFNTKHGDAEGDIRIEWFQTAVIEAIGEIDPKNYVTFVKAIGDASLLVFSSFRDVYAWSERLSENLSALSQEYPTTLDDRGLTDNKSAEEVEALISDFELRARRLVHLGEVSYKEKDGTDPLSLKVSQTFKVEKIFSETELGCTEPVADAVRGKLSELGVKLYENKRATIPGVQGEVMTYYVKK